MSQLQIQVGEEKYYRFILPVGLSDCHFTSFVSSVKDILSKGKSSSLCTRGKSNVEFNLSRFLRPQNSSPLIVKATWLLVIEVTTTKSYLQCNHIAIP